VCCGTPDSSVRAVGEVLRRGLRGEESVRPKVGKLARRVPAVIGDPGDGLLLAVAASGLEDNFQRPAVFAVTALYLKVGGGFLTKSGFG
jgi:hypothetical protein